MTSKCDLTIPPDRKLDTSSYSAPTFAKPKPFQPFSNFPKELRLKIWSMAAEEQRVIIVDLDGPGKSRTSSLPPAILHACIESREVGLKKYKLTFGARGHPGRTYFNFDQDVLFRHRSKKPYQTMMPVSRLPHPPHPFVRLDCNGKERIQYLYFDLCARIDPNVSLQWYSLNAWPALKGLYLGNRQKKSELDLNGQIDFVPLPEKDYKSFSRAYFDFVRYPWTQAPIPFKPLAARIEWIRTHCVREYKPRLSHSSWEEQSRYERIKNSVRLVKIVNSGSFWDN